MGVAHSPVSVLKRSGVTAPPAFWLVLGLGAVLIFWNLGVPSLWLDEAASPLNARYPFPYILELSRTLEEHPPLYYLALKGVMALGQEDFLLRLPSALCGLGCLVLVALLGRDLFGWGAGALAAALWLAMPQDLWLARIARPYALWLFFFLCSLRFLLRAAREGRARDLWLLLAANLLMTATHYLSFFLMAGEACALLACSGSLDARRRLRVLGLYLAGATTIVGIAYWALLRHSRTPQAILDYNDAPARILTALGQAVAGALYYFDAPAPRLLWLAAALLGFFALWRRDRPALRFLLPVAAVPVLLLFLFGKSTGLYSRHLAFLAPLASLALAGAAASLPPLAARTSLVTACVLVLAAGDALGPHRKDFYDLHSYQVPVIGNNYKQAADALAALAGPGTAVSYSNDFFGNAVSWYLANKPHPNPVDDQRLTPADATARLIYAASTHHGYLARSEAEFMRKFGPGARATQVDTTMLYALDVPRIPTHPVEALPARLRLDAAYPGFFATAAVLDGLRHHQNARSAAFVATRNDRDAVAAFDFENKAPQGPQDIFCNVDYDNRGRENLLAARAAFDDEPAAVFPLSAGDDAVHQRQVALRRDKPWKRLRLEIVLRCASLTPTLEGGNLETLRLRDVEAFFCPQGDAACADAAEKGLTASMLDNYLVERFLDASTVFQRRDGLSRDNIAEGDGEGQEGWSRLLAADPARPGVLGLDVTLDKPRLVFFPRLGQGASVRIWAVPEQGPRTLLFGLENTTRRWTPVSAQYELVVPARLRGKNVRLSVELSGRWAQLWQQGDTLFF